MSAVNGAIMSHASFSRYLLFLACLAPVVAPAQAWLPDKGAFNSTFIFNDVLNKEHWLPNGDTVDVGHTRSQTYALLANYGVTDKVMVSASLPYIITKFWDERGRPSHGGQPGFDVDDGDEHGAFTDLRVGVHYQLLEQPFALAPFIAYVTPVSDYYTRGHAAQGRGLDEVIVGFGAGKSLDPWLRRTYAQMRYSYGFVEEVQDLKHDRSNLNVELGTFLTSRWNVSLYGAWQWAHGGIDVPVPPSNPYFLNQTRSRRMNSSTRDRHRLRAHTAGDGLCHLHARLFRRERPQDEPGPDDWILLRLPSARLGRVRRRRREGAEPASPAADREASHAAGRRKAARLPNARD